MDKNNIWLILVLVAIVSSVLELTVYPRKPSNMSMQGTVQSNGKTIAVNAKTLSDNSVQVQTKLNNETVTYNYKDGCVHNKEQWDQLQGDVNVQKALLTLSHIRRIKEGFRDFCKGYTNPNVYEKAVSEYYKNIEYSATQTVINSMGKDYNDCYKTNMVPEFRKMDIKFAQHEFDSVKDIGLGDKDIFCKVLNDEMFYTSMIESSKVMLDEILRKTFPNNKPINFNFGI